MISCCCEKADEPVSNKALSKEDFIELGKKIAEYAILQLKGITKDDMKRLAKEIEAIFKKVKKHNKKGYKQAKKAVKVFLKTGKTDAILECLKTFKEKYI